MSKQIKLFIGGIFFVGLPMMMFVVEPGFSYVQEKGKFLCYLVAAIDALVVSFTFGHARDFALKLWWKDSRGNTEFNGVLMGAFALVVNLIWALLIE